MFGIFRNRNSGRKLEKLETEIIENAVAGRQDAALRKLEPLRLAQHQQPDVAESLLRIVRQQCLPKDTALDILAEILTAHHRNPKLLYGLGESTEYVADIDDLNAPPPEHPVFRNIVDALNALAESDRDYRSNRSLLSALATSARMLARQADGIAEECFTGVVEIDPHDSANHYNLGLFYKTRGRFEEGMKSNRMAASLVDEPVDSYEWNLGICATGCGKADVALDVWKRMGHEIEIGRFDLPEGRYAQCKVKLAQHPLAERGAGNDDPGLEETIWIERLSPCHGIVRSVLYQDLGVDYGDVVLIDGAPITYHKYGDHQIPVFPHLATLLRRNYQFFDFAGTQDEADQLAGASSELDRDVVIYSHTESFQVLCANCWRDPDIDHQHHEQMQKHVVTGRIAAPGDIGPVQLLEQVDQAVASRSSCQIFIPDLCSLAGFEDRARMEKRRFDLLRNN